MRIDHVIYAARDLDATAARLEQEHGLKAVGGGRHDGMGTHNTIVPLGGGYLEILAVADPVEAQGSPLGRAVTGRIEALGEGLMGWAAAVEDVAAVAERIGSEVSTIGRQGMTARLDRRRRGDGGALPAVLHRARRRHRRPGRPRRRGRHRVDRGRGRARAHRRVDRRPRRRCPSASPPGRRPCSPSASATESCASARPGRSASRCSAAGCPAGTRSPSSPRARSRACGRARSTARCPPTG